MFRETPQSGAEVEMKTKAKLKCPPALSVEVLF